MCWAHSPGWCRITGSTFLWASGKGDFSFRVNMDYDPKSLSDESMNWGPVCAHTHSISQTQKILTWSLTPFPQNSFRWEHKPRFSPCTHAIHRMDSKDPDIHVLDGWMPATKTHPPNTIHEERMWLALWLNQNTVTYAKISPKMVNPRDIAKNTGEEEKEEAEAAGRLCSCSLCCHLVTQTWQHEG